MNELAGAAPPPAPPAGRTALVRLGAGLVGWIFERITIPDEDTVSVRLRRRDAVDWIEVYVTTKAEQPVFKRLEHCSVRYRGRIGERSPALRAALGEIIQSIAETVDGALAAHPGARLAEALGRRGGRRDLVFDRDTVLELFEAHVPRGAVVGGGWRFEDVLGSTQVRGIESERPFVVLHFRHESEDRHAMFQLHERVDGTPAFTTSAHLALGLVGAFGDAQGSDALQALLGFVLQLQDHDDLSWTFPEPVPATAVLARPALAAPTAEEVRELVEQVADLPSRPHDAHTGEVLNLAIHADCRQQCAFCSVKLTNPPVDGGDEIFGALCRDLLENRRRGVQRVRLNGYDALAYSRIVDVLAFAAELGFDQVQIFSPFTLFADEAFCDRVLAAAPAQVELMVPLYGLEAEVHDRLVGRPGAFALVMQALDHLDRRGRQESVCLLSVITRDNAAAIWDLWRFARGRGYRASAHMPYTTFEWHGDRFFSSVPRQSDVAAAAAAALAASGAAAVDGEFVRYMLEGVAPCVVFRALAGAGVAPAPWLAQATAAPLPGTEYRDPRFQHRSTGDPVLPGTIPCPEADQCALASVCARAVLRSYADAYGIDELRAIALRDVVATAG